MNRFMTACIEPPDGVTGKAINLAYRKQAYRFGSERAMGIGWIITRDRSTRFHNGRTGGFGAAMLVNRQLKMGVCVLSNTANKIVDALAEEVLSMIEQTAKGVDDLRSVQLGANASVTP